MTSQSSVISQAQRASNRMYAEYQARFNKLLEIRRRQFLDRRRAAAAKRRAEKRAKAKALKFKCSKKGGKI
jgi:hypothetical protein